MKTKLLVHSSVISYSSSLLNIMSFYSGGLGEKKDFLGIKYNQEDLLVILHVVSVTACVFVLLPVLPVLAGRQQHHILGVVDVI